MTGAGLVKRPSSGVGGVVTAWVAPWAFIASLCASVAVGCLDEDKQGCRSDGDCRGVRVCRDAVCVTPEGFTDEDLAREFGFDAPGGDVVEGPVEGVSCREGAPWAAPSLTLQGGLEVQALATGLMGQVVRLSEDAEALVGELLVSFEGGAQATVTYPLLPEDPSPLNLDPVSAQEPLMVIVSYVGEAEGVGDRRLSVRTPQGALLLASCALDLAGELPCAEAEWRFAQEESSSLCPTDPDLCSPQRPSVVLSYDSLPTATLSPGQHQRVEADGVTWLRWAHRSERRSPTCVDEGAPERPLNALLMQVRR